MRSLIVDEIKEDVKLNWYALYTRPRFEKKVEVQLSEKEIETYLPLQTVVRQWSDRKKKIQEPIFRGYIFVHIEPKYRIESLRVDGVVRMVGFGGKPSVIPDDQIDAIQRLLDKNAKIEACDYFTVGDPVEVAQGSFAGIKGRLIEKRGMRRFVISIDAIRQSLSVEIDPGLLKKMPERF